MFVQFDDRASADEWLNPGLCLVNALALVRFKHDAARERDHCVGLDSRFDLNGGKSQPDEAIGGDMRLGILANRLVESKTTAPHFYLRGSAQVDRLMALRAEINDGEDVRVSVNDLVIKAGAAATVRKVRPSF